jgi:hypothetical protein
VKSADVLNDSLTADDLASGSVGFSEIQTDAVQASEIQDNSIDGGEIVDGSVRSTELGTITTRSATSAAIAPAAVGSVSVNCLAGEDVLSGGNDMSSTSEVVVASRKSGANGWAVFARNNSGVNQTVTVHAYCLAP